jgi:hypothetical protein
MVCSNCGHEWNVHSQLDDHACHLMYCECAAWKGERVKTDRPAWIERSELYQRWKEAEGSQLCECGHAQYHHNGMHAKGACTAEDQSSTRCMRFKKAQPAPDEAEENL